MRQGLGDTVKRLAGRRGTPQGQLGKLRRRVAALEDEVQENRRLNRRVAELLDLVEELLVPIAQRDEAKVQAYLDTHAADLRGPRVDGQRGSRADGSE
jgi:cell shape-determining protein MreC